MNLYGTIILAALLADYGLTLAAHLLNLRSLRRELPPELAEVFDAAAYARSQDYTRARTRYRLVAVTFDLAVLLGFWFAGGFAVLDSWVRSLELGAVSAGLVFIGTLVVAKGVLALPFSVYSTFVVEERFGFNRTTVATFVKDLAKGLALGVVLGVPLLAAILAFFERAGAAAWLYGWLLVTAVSFVLQLVVPTWIMPLFNKFEPLPEGELRDAIAAYARRVDFALAGVFVIDGSRRSSHANAFFSGLGKSRRIALFDTLVAKHTVPELVAVLAHEIGHYKKGHIVKSLVLGVIHGGAMFYLLGLFLRQPGLFAAFGIEEPSVYAGLVFFALLYAPAELLLQLVLQKISRRNEYEADRFAAETADPGAMIAALKRLAADSLTNLTPHPLYVVLTSSHPPVLERIRAIRAAASTAA